MNAIQKAFFKRRGEKMAAKQGYKSNGWNDVYRRSPERVAAEKNACHEAGHAVMAAALGLAVASAKSGHRGGIVEIRDIPGSKSHTVAFFLARLAAERAAYGGADSPDAVDAGLAAVKAGMADADDIVQARAAARTINKRADVYHLDQAIELLAGMVCSDASFTKACQAVQERLDGSSSLGEISGDTVRQIAKWTIAESWDSFSARIKQLAEAAVEAALAN